MSKKACEKMFKITNYQRNVNQNYNEVLPDRSQKTIVKKVYK